MSTDELLNRINYLSKKSKQEGLSEAERKEQKQLREQYLAQFKKAFKKQLSSVTVIDPEGNDVTPEKLKRIKKQ